MSLFHYRVRVNGQMCNHAVLAASQGDARENINGKFPDWDYLELVHQYRLFGGWWRAH